MAASVIDHAFASRRVMRMFLISFLLLLITSCGSTRKLSDKDLKLTSELKNIYKQHYGWKFKKINLVSKQENKTDFPLAYCINNRDGLWHLLINTSAELNNTELAGAAHICELSSFSRHEHVKYIWFRRKR